MFSDNPNFNQDLSSWRVFNTLSYQNFDLNATSWALPKPAFGVGWQPLTKGQLQTAVNVWTEDEEEARALYGDINTWNVSSITDMEAMFNQKSSFNSDIGNWDMSNVTTMLGMFSRATSFNQDISSWDVSSVTNISQLFFDAENFNQPLDSWDVSNVTDMSYMFDGASSFNQNISS